MSEYNDFFDFNANHLGLDAVDSEYPAPTADLDQSAVWAAPLQASYGLVGGDTAASLQLDVDSAPSAGAGFLGRIVTLHSCAVCHEPYQTDSALHRHALEAQHQAYRCKCGTGFNKASALNRHIETKDAPKTFPCPLCDDKFARKDKVKDHCRHFHKATDEQKLRVLLSLQGVNPRAGPASRRGRGAVASAGASSGTHASLHAPVHAPAHGLAHTPATAGPSVWPFSTSAGQQYAGIRSGPSVPTGPLATTSTFQAPNSSSFVPKGRFVSSADALAVDPALDEDFSGLVDDFTGDESWATGFDGFDGFNF